MTLYNTIIIKYNNIIVLQPFPSPITDCMLILCVVELPMDNAVLQWRNNNKKKNTEQTWEKFINYFTINNCFISNK